MSKIKVPSVQQYAAVLDSGAGLTELRILILLLHYYAPKRTVTSKQLAEVIGSRVYSAVNLNYGRLAGIIGKMLGYEPPGVNMGTLVTFEQRQGELHWIMRPEVAQAIELLCWTTKPPLGDSKMPYIRCKALIEILDFDRDDRESPDSARRGRFLHGWEDATVRSTTYNADTLKKLTWHNLGYRLGKLFGAKPPSIIRDVFEKFASHRLLTNKAAEEMFTTAEEVDVARSNYREGAVRQIMVNVYERNSEARRLCIKKYGAVCFVCGFDFAQTYGETGKGLIHVHHLKALHTIGEDYEVDPIKDLRPVCPNCHAIIHRISPPYTIDQVKDMLDRVWIDGG